MIQFESRESMRRYEDFLSRWKHVIGHYYSERKQSIIEARGQYTWSGFRDALEKRIQQALAMNGNGVKIDIFEEVEYWGFGVKTISKYNDEDTILRKTKVAFDNLKLGRLKEAAEERDGLPHVGPARATKLLALSDQKIYGIYDARASNALREVNYLAGQIIIPVLPGRTITGTGGNHALGFENFTWALRFMAESFSTEYPECKAWRVADVEMALFILGRRSASPR